MNADPSRAAGLALIDAAKRFEGQAATPAVCQRIKREFILVMRTRYGVDWSRHARQIKVEFINGGRPNLIVPPHLLMRTVH